MRADGLYRQAGKASWYCRVYDHAAGRWIYRSTKMRDRAAAREVAARWEREAADPAGAAVAAATLGDALEARRRELEDCVRSGVRSADTLDFYTRKAQHLVRILGADLLLRNLLPPTGGEIVDRYVRTRRAEWALAPRPTLVIDGESADAGRDGRHVADHTIKKELICLGGALKLANRRGLWAASADAIMPRGFGAGYVPRKRWLTPSEVSRLVAVLPADRAARVAFMVATGAEWRATERALDEDVWPDLSVVHIRGTKRESRDRLVPIVTAAQRCLLEIVLAKARGTDGHIFRPWSNVSRDLAAACASAGIERCSPNDLRRSFAHWLKEFNVSNEALAPAMGHTTTRMLERVYARLDVNEIRAAMLADIRASAQPA